MPKRAPIDKISPAQQKAIDWIKGHNARELGELGSQVGVMLAELTAELADAKAEASHYKNSLAVVIDEMQVAIACILAGGGERGADATGNPRLIVRKADFEKALGLQLHTQQPDAHTRIYELRKKPAERTKVDDAVSRIIRPH